ncbi:MAG: ATP-binding protein [Candidatus Thorarchaeota archaeon]
MSSKKGEIPIGQILKGRFRKHTFLLSLKDLEKHMFICGATGTGKSNFLQNFLIHFTRIFNIPFFLVEFKGEYHFLQKKIDNVLVLWPGENFSINIFNPGNSNPIIHAERIFDILKSGQFLDDSSEFSPQMEKVLVEILTRVCQNKNFQNWEGFEYFCDLYLRENKYKIPMLSQTLISIKNRIRRFSRGPLKVLFEEDTSLNMQELFENNILLDLSSIIRLGGEKEDGLFFLNMILKYLWDKNLMVGAYDFKGIQHLTIIEDAQYFAPQDVVKKSKITTYLEDIALLQRGTGECLITLATRPDISKEILANNGIVLTFKNHLEKDIMCELLNLEIENKNFLSILEEGQCIVRVNSIKEPFLLKVPYIKNKSLPFPEIYRENKLILEKIREENRQFPKLNTDINFFKFKRILRVVKRVFSLKLYNNAKKPNEDDNNMDIVPEIQDHFLDAKKSSISSDYAEKDYEHLKNYIEEIYKMQNEKE